MIKLNEQRKIFKIHSTFLKDNKWNLDIPPESARIEYPDMIVALGESQLLRWLDELTGKTDVNWKIAALKNNIKVEKKKNITSKTKYRIRDMYRDMFALQFQPNYIEVVMDKVSHYDLANQGFTVNGIRFKRLLGTNGGIKQSTIVYVNEELYPELKKRIDNGRNMNKELVPAKLEAYQALTASGSTPIPMPNGIIVVNDCITHFKENVICISDVDGGEPKLEYVNDYEIEHNNSDGYGLMLPSYSRKVNQHLTGNDAVISGMNTRYAWNKGVLFAFDFIEFAEKIAKTYEIVDAWGNVKDIRNAEVILTVSMLKLWDSYSCWEDYYNNCIENHYQFATPKMTPDELENVRTTNYQFLQSYDFSDDELMELCKPTIDEINDVLGYDWRKSVLFTAGMSLNEKNVKRMADDWVKALMIEPALINDPYIRKSIYKAIEKKIHNGAKGTIKVNGNYCIIGGDVYALAQSMFNLPVTGLLKAGEVYHKYFIDNGDSEIVCFRAPMTCHNNIRKMKLSTNADAAYWYQYINTALIYNAWDTTAEALNGADFDGDTNLCTNHPLLLAKTKNAPTIICNQRKAEKKIPTEDDIIAANKLAFNDDIGAITNRITAMFDVQSAYAPDSPEYKELEYRIMCGQHYQQASIDRCKGIIAEDMPEYWYSIKSKNDYTDLQRVIVADKKPYFMRYIYPNVMSDYRSYIAKCNSKSRMMFKGDIESLMSIHKPSEEIQKHLKWYHIKMPVSINNCVVNRICRIFEKEFSNFAPSAVGEFDYTILKSNVGYTQPQYKAIKQIYEDYKIRVASFMNEANLTAMDKDTANERKQFFMSEFVEQCEKVCTNSKVLCDIVIDICYGANSSKTFAWAICGEQIINNLLERNDYMISIPVRDDDGEIEYCGYQFRMDKVEYRKDEPNARIYFE